MQKTILIHNPHCSKSRNAKDILLEAGIEFVTVDYINEGLKEKLLKKLPSLLKLSYIEMIRKNEDIFKELNLDGKIVSDKKWVTLLMKHPILLERPIFIHNDRAIIGRPAERVLEIM